MMSAPESMSVALETGGTSTALVYRGSGRPASVVVLAHGAGAGQTSGFMVAYARGLAALGLDVVTFNFPYTEQGRRLPDRAPVLESCFRAVVMLVDRQWAGSTARLAAGGKSMGGRIATQVAAAHPDLPVDGLVLLGYPLHPPGRPDQRRDAHLPAVRQPMLFVQGERDTFGTPAELAPVLERLSPRARLHVVDDGDHSFARKRLSKEAQAAVHGQVHGVIAEWIGALPERPSMTGSR